ncbi:MAG: DsbA family protein [Leptolyngbyaceae cyanobacterium bins.349]|nr:DsbA family protein [Leptolyngbyaceae cyanobacterium bins.349]
MSLPYPPDRLIQPVSAQDHCQGDPTATITVVQYGDYQCSGCRIADEVIRTIQQQLGPQMRFVFRHFPQSQFHPDAYHAAEAAEAAGSQGKFWEMHHHLFAHQSQLADCHLVEYAIALLLDVNQFLAEMANDCHLARIDADLASGRRSGVIHTPTFFINGWKYRNDQSLDGLLEAMIQAQPESELG